MKKFYCFIICLLVLCLLVSCTDNPLPADDSSAESGSVSSAAGENSDVSYADIPIHFSEEESVPDPGPDESDETNAYVLFEYENTFEATHLFVWSADKGILLRKGNMADKIYPASLTKLVTALVALQYADPEVICVAGDEISLMASDASRAWIPVGSKSSVEQLIEGMLLPSGCDAAYVLAAGVGRLINPDATSYLSAVSAFVEAMNKWSKENGLQNSYWMNPDGGFNELHYSCMADMLHVANLALDNEIISKYIGLYQDKVKLVSGEGNTWTNTNAFLNPESSYYDPSCIGIKTGMTEGGGCLLTCFRDGEMYDIIGVFGTPSSSGSTRFKVTKQAKDFILSSRSGNPDEIID